VKNWKNGQIFQNGQMCFFMASVFKKWPNFSKLAMKWPMWQLWYCSWTPRTHRKQDILLWIHHSLVQLHYFIKEAHYYIKVKSGSFQRYWYTVYLQSIAVQISVRMKCPLESGENWAKHFILGFEAEYHVTDRKCFLNTIKIAAVTFQNIDSWWYVFYNFV